MIDFFEKWVINIITIVTFIILLEIIIPSGRIRKFVNLVSGFILIIAIINPLVSFLKKGADISDFQIKTSNFLDRKAIEKDSRVLQAGQMKQITAAYRNKIISQLEDKAKKLKGVSAAKADVIINEDYSSDTFGEIKRVYLELKPGNGNSTVNPVAKVEKVEINKKGGAGNAKNNTDSEGTGAYAALKKDARKQINKFLDVPEDNIVVSISK